MSDERMRNIARIVGEVFEVKVDELGRSRLSGQLRDARAVIFGLADRVFDMSSVEIGEAWGCSHKTVLEGIGTFLSIDPDSRTARLRDRAHNRVRSWLSHERQPFLD